MRAHLRSLVATLACAGVLGLASAPALAAPGSPASPSSVVVPAGTVLHLQLANGVGSDTSRIEDPVRATLTRPVVVAGRTVVPAGSVVAGNVVSARRAGHLKGRSRVAFRFYRLQPAETRSEYRIRTQAWGAVGPSLKRRDAVGLGIPAAAGAMIGGAIGGAKGAGIGAAAGGGAGATRLMVTRGEDVRIRPGALVTVRLSQPVTVQLR